MNSLTRRQLDLIPRFSWVTWVQSRKYLISVMRNFGSISEMLENSSSLQPT